MASKAKWRRKSAESAMAKSLAAGSAQLNTAGGVSNSVIMAITYNMALAWRNGIS